MRVTCTFKDDYQYELRGMYESLPVERIPRNPVGNKDYFAGLNTVVTDCIKEAKDIRTGYMEAIGNDNRISSQERVDLIQELDEFLVSLINLHEMLRANIIAYRRAKRLPLDEDETLEYSNVKLHVNLKTMRFELSGRLAANDVNTKHDFTQWHDQSFITRIKDMLLSYHESIADQVLEPQELDTLFKGISEIIYQAILMRYLIEHCLIHE
jgi:hypothetical protein